MSFETENLVAKLMRGKTTPHTYPVDIVGKGTAYEVKSLDVSDKTHKASMKPAAIERKNAWCDENGIKNRFTILAIVSGREIEVYQREGFGGYHKSRMTYVGSYPRKNIKIKKSTKLKNLKDKKTKSLKN
jgi:Fe2+ transport system protein FeoA